MAKRPLKVFRTSAGFQDAYVAATSRKAALKAWGARTDLFASGIAEQITDPKLTKAALAEPGKVVRLARGTTAEHLAAAGKGRKPAASKTRSAKPSDGQPAAEPARPPRKKAPRPSRAKLERAEAALEKRTSEFSDALAAIDNKIDGLRKERDRLRSQRDADLRKLEERKAREDDAYRSALDAWE